jgi:hypothetical protein
VPACFDPSDIFHLSISAGKRPSKNEGPTHDVDENTGPVLVLALNPTMFLKTNGLSFNPTMS